MDDLGRVIKQQRLSLGLTLHDLATSSGVSASHLGRIERGERFPSARILRKIAAPLSFDESELLTWAGLLSPQSPIENDAGRLDPHVANLLSQEPIAVQRALVGLLYILKSLTR